MKSNISDLWYMFCQVILLMYRSIYYFDNLCLTHNNVIDIYIMGILLKKITFLGECNKNKTQDKPTSAY